MQAPIIKIFRGWTRNFRHGRHLIVFVFILVAIVMVGSSLIFASGLGNDGEIVATVIVEKNPDGPNKSIWSDKPQLGGEVGQTYYGRVVLELWDHDGNISYDSDPSGQNSYLLEQALLGLEDVGKTVYVNSPWTNEPVTGEYPEQTFQGRIVVEVWNNQAVVAVKGIESDSNLVKRAKEQIKAMIEEEQTQAIFNGDNNASTYSS